jgi:cell wall-associated NlpC family hydrolase
MSLLDAGYRFGGKNPEAGIDCSGMVSHVFRNAAGVDLSGSAADIARRGRQVASANLTPGDLVFFDTRGGRYTHVGIYIGEGRFIHAPSTASGRVKIARLDESYFARRFTEARAYLD